MSHMEGHDTMATRVRRMALVGAAAVLLGSASACLSAGGSSALFCDAAKDLATLDERSDIDVEVSSEDSEAEAKAKLEVAEQQFREAAAEARTLLDRFEREAPDEIKDDVATVAEFVRSFFSALEAGARGEQIDPPSIDMQQVEQSGERVREYVSDECGVELDPIGVDAPSIPELPTVPSIPDIPIPTAPSIPSAPTPNP